MSCNLSGSTVGEDMEEAALHLQTSNDTEGWLKENITYKFVLCCFMKRMLLRAEPE